MDMFLAGLVKKSKSSDGSIWHNGDELFGNNYGKIATMMRERNLVMLTNAKHKFLSNGVLWELVLAAKSRGISSVVGDYVPVVSIWERYRIHFIKPRIPLRLNGMWMYLLYAKQTSSWTVLDGDLVRVHQDDKKYITRAKLFLTCIMFRDRFAKGANNEERTSNKTLPKPN